MADVELPAQGFVPRDYQLPVMKYMLQDKPGLRAILCWHRRCGKDLLTVNILAMKALQRKGLYLYIGPFQSQMKKIIWRGADGQGRGFIDFIPKELVTRKSEQEMSLTLVNGSVIQLVGADDGGDRCVGTNPVGIMMSEAALCTPRIWQILNPVLAENGGWWMCNSTPRGKNWFWKMLEEAKVNPEWFASHLPVTKTKAVSAADLRKARAEMNSEALFQQEFMASFEIPVEGSYYGPIITKLYKKKQMLEVIPPDPSLPVHTGWDLGMDDATTIWAVQLFQKEIRIVAYYENSGEGLAHYAKWLHDWSALHDVTFGKHYFPHDVKVRELGSGRSRIETLRKLGIRAIPVKKLSIMDGIEAVRNILPRCWFSIGSCGTGIEHLKDYSKEFDPIKQVYRKQPKHDQHSHGADAFRTLAVGLKEKSVLSRQDRKERATYQTAEVDF